ncbi:glycosyltransferase [Staphylococcus equorum]|uniref:glycosyltransferase n=1 Tax=Staphylococcus equorum TaxID=246432 RepID=UPI0003A72831|nr:glycosyltransferase [Staphylococcus equorum]MEB7722352.1 glycosyltransferase [Staphylococcus equorum]PTE37081.1 glycosyl transferase family 1 [Staphylococcus equorum]PTE83366.1 glycosyl transferase family 1 [Staphylococcus equorum]PTE93414.1 glycosyl transferase family 1 [Staphylococcus equorum]QQT22485.1 glycosyltransferase [Staphylococcus equorum]
MLYTITSTLPPVHGGRTKALLNRIQLMHNDLNETNTILTTNYNPNYYEVIKSFVENNKLNAQIRVENIYDWLSDFKLLYNPHSNSDTIEYQEVERDIEGLRSEIRKNNRDIVRYYDGDTYFLYRKFRPGSNILEFEDFMTPYCKKRVERHQYNNFGHLHKKIYFSTKNYGKIAEKFYDREGNKYCEKFFADDENTTLLLIQLYKEGKHFKAFENEKQLFQYYFQNRFKDGDIVFNDARLLDIPLLKQTNHTKNVLVFHSSHIDGNNVKKAYKYALTHSDCVTKYLVLTNHQKIDIQNLYSIEDERFAVIPHFIEVAEPSREPSNFKDQFIYIGRFGVGKQLDHLIKAYKLFREAGYTSKLVLYGKDEAGQLKMLKNQIEEYDLNEYVEINDYTSNPLAEFKASRASLLTSSFEGFGLTIMESIAVGCPAISYDVQYGPREIIEHGKNGYLIEPNNILEFANGMMKIVDKPLNNVKNNERLKHQTAINNYAELLKQLQEKITI